MTRSGPVGNLVAISLALAVLAASCSGGSSDSGDQAPTTTGPGDNSPAVVADEFDPFVMTVNIDITENGYEPASLFVPAGRSLQLVVRNRTSTEHHYRVSGLEASELLWLSEPDMVIEEGVSEEEHLLHHQAAFVDWRGTSPNGIKPTLEEVHAYCAGGQVDIIRFRAMSIGTYVVDDPLHPELTGEIKVFG
ncbi:MAG: hypothetical protein ACR2OI_00975 [Acidimicrobiia bacterium]